MIPQAFPVVWLGHPAVAHRPVGLESVADGVEAELVEPGEPGQVR